MGTITERLDQVDAEQDCERVEKRICECCHGRGWLFEPVTRWNAEPTRECEYCGGRGWLQVLPVRPGAYW